MELPRSLEDINPDWLTFALSQKFPGAKVKTVTLSNVIHGSATKAKLIVQYASGANEDLPATMWLKIGFEPHSDVIREAGFYDAEAACYRSYLPLLDIGAPICYYEQVQTAPPQTAILLEDIGARPAICGVATSPLSIEQTAAGLKTLAKLHAKTWNSPIVDKLGAKPALQWGEQIFLGEYVDNATAHLTSLRGYSIPLKLHDPDRLATVWKRYQDFVVTGPKCLLHGDAHVGNSFVQRDGVVAFLDWQVVSSGHWIHDVAYFMASALDIPDRRSADRDLLKSYLSDITRYGVTNPPSFDEAWDCYRKGLTFALVVWLGNPDSFQKPEINLASFARAGAAFEENDGFGAFGA